MCPLGRNTFLSLIPHLNNQVTSTHNGLWFRCHIQSSSTLVDIWIRLSWDCGGTPDGFSRTLRWELTPFVLFLSVWSDSLNITGFVLPLCLHTSEYGVIWRLFDVFFFYSVCSSLKNSSEMSSVDGYKTDLQLRKGVFWWYLLGMPLGGVAQSQSQFDSILSFAN